MLVFYFYYEIILNIYYVSFRFGAQYIYTKNNSQFLTIFAQNLTNLPHNSKYLTYSAL